MARIINFATEQARLEYNVGAKALRKFMMGTYKQLIFHIIPDLQKGDLPGELQEDGTYKVVLKTSSLFSFIYGVVCLTYSIEDNRVLILSLNPSQTLALLYKGLPPVVEGVPVLSMEAKNKLDFYISLKKEVSKCR